MSEKLRDVFAEALGIDKSIVNDTLMYNEIEEWDSIAHMTLVGEIEDRFDIMLDTDDIIDMSSFAKAKEIVNKYLEG
jgi:acyl carrier protein